MNINSFRMNADSLQQSALEIFAHTDEGKEGARAFAEKRPAEFARYVTA
jgi:1,4-dihydroxy-2-naphthoyl-CoA synthase